MAHTRLRPSFSFTDEKLADLKRIAPEAFADGRVNWEVLKEALGEHADDESAEAEHFGLNWPGKREARRMAGSPSTGALVPKPGDGVNEDSTRNIFIEGENLEVLKLLQKAYRGKVKMIYIDPPYNTGNDFVYEDDFTEPLEEYLRRTGQVDEEGRKLTTNTRADGRFHSKWLSMMYPRLRLARQLLRDDGVIFVSIDDNEVHNLRSVMNEVFGDENFIGMFTWVKKKKGSHLSKTIRSMTEYVVLYGRNAEDSELYGEAAYSDKWQPLLKRTNSHKVLSFPDGVVSTTLEAGKYPPGRYGKGTSGVDLIEEIAVADGVITTALVLKGPFTWSQRMLDEEVGLGTKVSLSKLFGVNVFRHNQEDKFKRPSTLLDSKVDVGTNEDANAEVNELLGEGYMDYPKPVSLIKYLVQSCTFFEKDAIVMDFFAGSGTTAQAVQELNDADEGERKFVLVQLPEQLDQAHPGKKEGFKTIGDLSKERLRRAFKKNKSTCGFKSLALTHSNYHAWKDYHGTDAQALEDLFAAQETPLREGWSVEGLTTEVMLLEGFPLDSRVEVQKAFKKNTVQRIHHEWHAHALFVCLDKQIHAETIAALVLGEGDTFICLDTAIDDQSKLRLSDKGMIKTI